MNPEEPRPARPVRNIQPPPPRPKWIPEGGLTCLGPGCSKPIPAGWYGNRRQNYFCSYRCETAYYWSKKPLVRCAVCGKEFHRGYPGHKLCSRKCFSVWRKRPLNKRVGRFLPLLEGFCDACRQKSKATHDDFRSNVALLLTFLVKRRIRSVNSVRPVHITEFLKDVRESGRWNDTTALVNSIKLFFDWTVVMEKRKRVNPVVLRFHREKKVKRLPRPYSEAELAVIWRLLEQNGDKALMAAVAFAQQAGCRISEVVALLVSNVDLEKQEARVRLSKTGGAWHTVPFHTKAKQYLQEWLAVRGERDHDFVFVGPSGAPMATATLRKRLNRVLCGPDKLASFSFHRLRGYAATTLAKGKSDVLSIARTIGWRELSSAQHYIALDTADLHEDYHRIMEQRVDEKRERPVVQSLDEFFGQQKADPAVKETVDPVKS
jgi:site-specific recombinase XerC